MQVSLVEHVLSGGESRSGDGVPEEGAVPGLNCGTYPVRGGAARGARNPIWGDPEVKSTGKMAVDRGLIQPRVEECQRRNRTGAVLPAVPTTRRRDLENSASG